MAQVDDPKMVLSRATQHALSETRLLKYLAPWVDAMFNQAQADDLRNDIRHILRSHLGTPLADILASLEPLIDRLSTETHVYLWFLVTDDQG